MAVVGIIAEYNPFHNGHAYMLSEARKIGADGVIIAMSGNFTQRAEPAILCKRARAEMALRGGADLVLELPLPFALAGAETFANGGVRVLSALGVADTLFFGSECGDIALLTRTAEALRDTRVNTALYKTVQTGMPYAAARESAVRAVYGDATADVLRAPNNTLAVEYLRALYAQNSTLCPKTLLRAGTPHDSCAPSGNYASASFLRETVRAGESCINYMPGRAAEILEEAVKSGAAPADFQKLDIAILSFLRKCTPADFAVVPDVSEGIENRILSAARTACTLQEVFDSAKTKRYTHARLRRIVLCAFLGIQKEDVQNGVQYLRVLGFSERGKALLRAARKAAKLPIVMRASDVQTLSAAAQRQFSLECIATDIFNLTLPEIRPCGTDMTDNLIRI